MSSTLKAIRINKTNKHALENQYSMSEGFLEHSSGLYLVAEFGATQYKGILTPAGFARNYVAGKVLKNGFFEVEKKVA